MIILKGLPWDRRMTWKNAPDCKNGNPKAQDLGLLPPHHSYWYGIFQTFYPKFFDQKEGAGFKLMESVFKLAGAGEEIA